MPYSSEEVRETVLAIIEQLAPERDRFEAGKDMRLVEDLGFHSLALLEMAFAIEDDFDLPPIDEQTGRAIQTTEQVLAYVLGQVEVRAPS
ncbi:acyl carrier protein [Streptomyces sp. NPDC059752]|uniref:acyl carrier protein n=1 Tax=unclassified Streptomyces TaxID=2593676 RepID=UPI00364EDD6A